MRRREFIAGLGSAAGWTLAARAQQPAVPVIGFLSSGSRDRYRLLLDAFRQGLHDQGYVDGDHPVIDRRAFVTIMGGSMLAVPLERGQGRLERWGENGGSVNSRPLYPPNAPVD